ncbi:MAG: phosphoenolpyruvate carboxykinase (ATP) [Chloroflexota bacterium]|nr:MAG: phosphoenolpyruvate carboxykinase (ATP) [Chloroflexota bacterium]
MVQLHTRHGLEHEGIERPEAIYWNLPAAALYEEAVRRGEGRIAEEGPIVFHTGRHSGRSPKDKFVVRNPESEADIWWGNVNHPLEPEQFTRLHRRMLQYLNGKQLFVQNPYAVADPEYRLPVRIITEQAYHSLFVRNMFINALVADELDREPRFTVIDVPSFQASPEEDGTRSNVVVVLNFEKRLLLIGGTSYAGEIKKGIFTVLNYLMPKRGILSMHCSANYGPRGDVALFFGLSGTGKTTLSTDPERTLIGDDEHGWGDRGVFNFEGGSYAKTINISAEAEPLIYSAVHRFGSVLENVAIDPDTRRLDLDDESLTENTRAAFPLSFIPRVDPTGMGGHPENVVFLTADAFGVLPPISRLTKEQAQYYFLSGYTAKVAGTEKGVTEPQPNFSTCFGAPFLAWPPTTYATMLGDKLDRHGSKVWLINTGWTGGPYGTGSRIEIDDTRSMVRAVLRGDLTEVPTQRDHHFGLHVVEHVPGVSDNVLNPKSTWQSGDAYDQQAHKLAALFEENFARNFADEVSDDIRAAGPSVKR